MTTAATGRSPHASRARLRALDALRGLAAAIVALHHARTLFPGVDAALARMSPALAEAFLQLTRRNVEAVLLFFVISGFSIATSVHPHGFNDRAATRRYALRRVRRILPLYWASLVLAALVAFTVAPVSDQARSLSTLLGNLLFLQTAPGVPGQWVEPWAANAPLWSLSFEVFYYAAFPLLWRTVPSRRARLGTVLVACVVGHAWSALAPNPLAMFLASGLIWYLGAELAALWHDGSASVPIGAFVALWVVALALRLGPRAVDFHGLWIGASWFLLAAVVMRWSPDATAPAPHSSMALARAYRLVSEPLVRLGGASYALYLLHVPVLRATRALGGPGPTAALGGLFLAGVVAFAAERLVAHAWPRPILTTAPGASA